jgi:hypothetical protein
LETEVHLLGLRFSPPAGFSLVAVSSLALAATLSAQAAAPDTVRLASGYICGNQFRVRNDGAQAVTAEYNVVGSTERSRLMLEPKESIEITSASPGALELHVNGKVVATEPKGNKPCVTAKPVRPAGAPADSAAIPARVATPQQSAGARKPRPHPLVNPPYPVYAPPFYVPVTDMIWVLRPRF